MKKKPTRGRPRVDMPTTITLTNDEAAWLLYEMRSTRRLANSTLKHGRTLGTCETPSAWLKIWQDQATYSRSIMEKLGRKR